MVPLVTALAAGNTVILKPSEITPTIGELVHFLCKESGLPEDVVQVVQGGGEVGRRLIKAGPDKIFFTGSVETGKKVMRAASEELIPLALELGGKDPMIVFSDAHFDRAVQGALYGAFSNAGQTCISVERCYVQESIYQRFVEALSREVQKLRVGSGIESDFGPIISPHQIPVIEDQIEDALNKGARVITNGKRQGSFMQPVILVDVDHSMKVMKEETFGPVLPIMPFTSEDGVIRLANDSIYGLGASIWTSDLEKGERVARQLMTGNCAINDVIRNVANPHLPYGGVKKSGIGRYHGPEGLGSFSIQTSIMVNKGKRKREVNWFPYSRKMYDLVRLMMCLRYQKGLRKKAEKMVDFLFRKSGKEGEKEKEVVS
jgi:acyl-CoA reductase-like NAD-dependent aldehyde dehydrogenase